MGPGPPLANIDIAKGDIELVFKLYIYIHIEMGEPMRANIGEYRLAKRAMAPQAWHDLLF
jgi:hypothetical protein